MQFFEELVHGLEFSTRPAVVASKPLNKKIKFSYSDSSNSDDDEEDEDEEAKSHACKDDANNENPTNEKSDPQKNKAKCHENQTAVVTDGDKEEGKNQENQVNDIDEPPVKKQCLETDAPKKEEQSIDKLIEAELKELGDRNKVSKQ